MRQTTNMISRETRIWNASFNSFRVPLNEIPYLSSKSDILPAIYVNIVKENTVMVTNTAKKGVL